MKKELSSADIYVLVRELSFLEGARVDKSYQIGERKFKIKFHVPGQGTKELIITPDFFTLSRYSWPTPQEPTPLAMQIRKHLQGGFIRKIRQKGFDRILEIVVEAKDKRYLIIAELFGKGNLLLVEEKDYKVLGLLEWQKWKDRKLGVGKVYEYPPEGENPIELKRKKLKRIFGESNRKIVSLLASLGWGGLYAEEICHFIDKDKNANELTKKEFENIYSRIQELKKKLNSETDPKIIYTTKKGEENSQIKKQVDVIPFSLDIYQSEPLKGQKKEEYNTFYEAIDEYFSQKEFQKLEKEASKRYKEERQKLEKRKEYQKESLKELQEKQKKYQLIGELIYQNYQNIKEIQQAIQKARKKGIGLEEIKQKLEGREVGDIKIKKIDEKDEVVAIVETTDKNQ